MNNTFYLNTESSPSSNNVSFDITTNAEGIKVNINKGDLNSQEVSVVADISSSNGLMELAALTNEIRSVLSVSNSVLTITNLPANNSVVIDRLYATIINSLKFDGVTVFDCVSKSLVGMIDSCVSVGKKDFITSAMKNLGGDDDADVLFVVPDMRNNDVVTESINNVIGDAGVEEPIRDLVVDVKVVKGSNGSTSDVYLLNDNIITNHDCVLVIDTLSSDYEDLVSISKLLKETKNCNRITIIASHTSIGESDADNLKAHFDKIITTDSIANTVSQSDFVEVHKYSNFI